MNIHITQPASNGQAAKAVTGQYLARAVKYPPGRRAEDAAGWLRGQVIIRPTIKLAAETFGVSVPLVVAARQRHERRDRGKRHGNGGITSLSDSAIDNIVREVGVERVWRAIERLTQPELPLAAAE
jgi:hypothetical protein